MKRRWVVYSSFACGAVAAFLNCVGDSEGPPPGPDADVTGTEGHACFGNGTCNAGLTCVSKVCVNLDGSTDAGNPGDGGVDASKDSGSGDGGAGDACGTYCSCMATNCPTFVVSDSSTCWAA